MTQQFCVSMNNKIVETNFTPPLFMEVSVPNQKSDQPPCICVLGCRFRPFIRFFHWHWIF